MVQAKPCAICLGECREAILYKTIIESIIYLREGDNISVNITFK
ncbi:hypothetical protein [Pelotomaculum terephthalicicum]|nr:hypothetical protein [Pelotomaculum terephthalicicum]